MSLCRSWGADGGRWHSDGGGEKCLRKHSSDLIFRGCHNNLGYRLLIPLVSLFWYICTSKSKVNILAPSQFLPISLSLTHSLAHIYIMPLWHGWMVLKCVYGCKNKLVLSECCKHFFILKWRWKEERAEDIATVGKCGIGFYREAHSTVSLRKNLIKLFWMWKLSVCKLYV